MIFLYYFNSNSVNLRTLFEPNHIDLGLFLYSTYQVSKKTLSDVMHSLPFLGLAHQSLSEALEQF